MKQSTKGAGARNQDQATAKAGANGENPSVGAAMVDALEDILHWERASERSMKVADKVS